MVYFCTKLLVKSDCVMRDYQQIIDKYYPEDNELKRILMVHSRKVADKSLEVAKKHPELHLDIEFLEEAAMLHDLGIFLTNAPGIQCFGTEPYICHGSIGAEILRKEGWPCHALVCERHTGAGLTLKQIEEQNLPVPHRELLPVSMEEQVICYADKFFSKTRPEIEKTPEQAINSLAKFGPEGVERFQEWLRRFG